MDRVEKENLNENELRIIEEFKSSIVDKYKNNCYYSYFEYIMFDIPLKGEIPTNMPGNIGNFTLDTVWPSKSLLRLGYKYKPTLVEDK